MADELKITVIKRDGEKEEFSFDKLIASILKAGVPMADAEAVSRKVEAWVQVASKNSGISSSEIRDKIIELLSNDFSVEADNYQAYIKD